MREDKCPICNSIISNFDSACIDGNQMYYPWECTNCGSTGEQWYDLVFLEHTCVEEKDNGR